jgi:ribosomal protein S18 acetylase RimI-like enzyme
VWVSEQDGHVVGFAYTRVRPDADLASGGELKLFYVDPCRKGEGIGLPLFKHAIGDLRERGLEPYLYTLKDNHAARGWYERRGWRADGAEMPWSNADEYPDILEVRYRPRD